MQPEYQVIIPDDGKKDWERIPDLLKFASPGELPPAKQVASEKSGKAFFNQANS
jgi:hypothetical protein